MVINETGSYTESLNISTVFRTRWCSLLKTASLVTRRFRRETVADYNIDHWLFGVRRGYVLEFHTKQRPNRVPTVMYRETILTRMTTVGWAS